MIWILSRTSIFWANKFLTITLNTPKFSHKRSKLTAGYSRNLLKQRMLEFQEIGTKNYIEATLKKVNTDGIISMNGMNIRKAKSEENVFIRTATESHFVCEEQYSSTQTTTSTKEDFFPSVFSQHLGPNSPYLSQIPMPPTPATKVSSSQNIQQIQRRYYMKSPANSPNRGQDEIAKVLTVLSKRSWENLDACKKKSGKHSFEFTLMCYNVLAQNLLDDHPYLYKYHNRRVLNWETRWKNLINEIKTMRPDILCLQEVQVTHLQGYFSVLESLGYKGIYKKRTGIRCDGCAIYFKQDRLDLVEYDTVEFYQPNISVLNRDNIAIVAKLCPRRNPNRQFIVATTHLLYNPKRQDVRLAQTQLLLAEVERLSFHRNSKGKERYWPIIITGDFNSTPDSVVYEFITQGFIKYNHLAERKMHCIEHPGHGNVLVPGHLEITDKCQHISLVQKRNQNEDLLRQEEAALIRLHNSDKQIEKTNSNIVKNPDLFSSGSLSHLFALKSVYMHGEPENPEGTTYQDLWITVDYIFYSGKKGKENIEDHKLKLLSRYRLPLRNELGSMKIPNSLIGSDHLSLVAKFKLKV